MREAALAQQAAGELALPDRIVAGQQAELEQLTLAAEAALEEHVFMRHGFVPAAAFAAGGAAWLSHAFLQEGALRLVLGLLAWLLLAPFVEERLGSIGLAALFPLSAALVFAFYQISTRMLGRNTDPSQTVLYTALVGTILSSLAVPFFWHPPTAAQWGLLIASGVFHGLGHIMLIRAFATAQASVLAPFNYAQIVTATALGLILFQELPGLATLAGIAVIVGAGLYVFHREQRLTR